MSPEAPKKRALSTSRPKPRTIDANVAAMTIIVERATRCGVCRVADDVQPRLHHPVSEGTLMSAHATDDGRNGLQR